MTADPMPGATSYGARALLPEGFRDLMPPWAEQEAALTNTLMETFAAHGYDRVNPPLVEFEESLAGAGMAPTRAAGLTAGTSRMFRLLDPASNRMMAVRNDMTLQVARMAVTRLAKAPRPLRLSYAGHVMRVSGSQLRPQRQFRQAGVELIGAEGRVPEAEVIALAVEAAQHAGLTQMSLDLTMPGFVAALAEGLGLTPEHGETLKTAMDAKDVGALEPLPQSVRQMGEGVLQAAGMAVHALATLRGLALPARAAAMVDELASLIDLIQEQVPDVAVTVDPGESRGFEYKTGIGFSLFAQGVRGAVCRGGRYLVRRIDGQGEPAVGFSLYLDTILQGIGPAESPAKLYLPAGTPRDRATALRGEGWRTVNGLAKQGAAMEEARRLGCSHILHNDEPAPVR